MSSSDGAADTPIIHKMNPRANKDSSGAIALLPFFDGSGAMLKAQARQSSIEDLTERNLAASYLQWFASDQHLLKRHLAEACRANLPVAEIAPQRVYAFSS